MNMHLTLREWQQIPKDPSTFIVQASSMDCDDGWRHWPIGMSWQYVLNASKGGALQIGEHSYPILCAIHTHTDTRRRPNGINRSSIIHTLQQNGIPNTDHHHTTYFDTLPSYKFVVSPEGNGIDCHRHYEALMAGCIPIMERHPGIEEKYKGCPILWTTDYSEITPTYLETVWKDMIDQTYDFSRLFLSYYDNETQQLIKKSGNFWLQRIDHTRCSWY